MKFSSIKREHLLLAAEELDATKENSWTEYWMDMPEKGKAYPFKLLIRIAYKKATGEDIKPDFFTSSRGYRDYFENKFGYKIHFRVRDNIPFFSLADLDHFKSYGGKQYRTDVEKDRKAGDLLKRTIYSKTNTLIRALDIPGFTFETDNQWQISGNFKPYSWTKFYRKHANNKKIFFTVGIEAGNRSFVMKLDCQRKSYTAGKALTQNQIDIFDKIVKTTKAEWFELSTKELLELNWEKLIEKVEDFINYYISLYDEVVSAMVENKQLPLVPNSLTLTDLPKGIKEIPERKVIKKNSNADYDKDNKNKKSIGDGGEQLVLTIEKQYLINNNRQDLADKVEKVLDFEGYDILSYDELGNEKYIEVKTTTASSSRPFIITITERNTMLRHAPFVGNQHYGELGLTLGIFLMVHINGRRWHRIRKEILAEHINISSVKKDQLFIRHLIFYSVILSEINCRNLY